MSVCAGLVVVDEQSSIIRLVHYTTQEYFERTIWDWKPNAQLEIASICLTYLSFRIFRDGECSTNNDLKRRLQLNPFLDYAANFWGHHALPVQHEVCDLACSFLLYRGSISCAIQVMERSMFHSECLNFIHLAARFGLEILIKKLLETGEGEELIVANSEDSFGNIGLSIAAAYGHDKTVSLLSERVVKMNMGQREAAYALSVAASRGHEQVVKVLLNNGADIYIQLKSFRQRLRAAKKSRFKQEERSAMLIGVQAYAKKKYYNRAIRTAAENGHEAVVKLLLDKGAEPNVGDGYYGNTLQAASSGCHEAVVNLLLGKGADPNTQGGYYNTALQAASSRGYEAVVNMLKARGAK